MQSRVSINSQSIMMLERNIVKKTYISSYVKVSLPRFRISQKATVDKVVELHQPTVFTQVILQTAMTKIIITERNARFCNECAVILIIYWSQFSFGQVNNPMMMMILQRKKYRPKQAFASCQYYWNIMVNTVQVSKPHGVWSIIKIHKHIQVMAQLLPLAYTSWCNTCHLSPGEWSSWATVVTAWSPPGLVYWISKLVLCKGHLYSTVKVWLCIQLLWGSLVHAKYTNIILIPITWVHIVSFIHLKGLMTLPENSFSLTAV